MQIVLSLNECQQPDLLDTDIPGLPVVSKGVCMAAGIGCTLCTAVYRIHSNVATSTGVCEGDIYQMSLIPRDNVNVIHKRILFFSI